jgi:hypothetical protein
MAGSFRVEVCKPGEESLDGYTAGRTEIRDFQCVHASFAELGFRDKRLRPAKTAGQL